MDLETKKQVLRRITYGLYIVTATSDGNIAAGAVNWLSQASFSPPLVMAGIKVESHLHALIERSRGFAVNILADNQQDVAATFFQPSQIEGDRINGLVFERGPKTAAPLLVDLPAWFEVMVTDAVRRGDHTVYVGEVIEAGLRNADAKPLDMWTTKWFYGG